ncbi:SHD1 domain-containing protein [Pontiellaceae bacterium B12219]|nr:SHD1 domain-containing protein [Pontiellaceae bacterium B12219]
MKKRSVKDKGAVKGAPSGFMISLMIHAGAFLLAGMLVVFSVTQKEEKKFIPPKPVDRPKMDLKKPQVKVKKSAKPQSTTRIVTKIEKANMPDLELPELGGMGDGLVGGVGGFDIIPDLTQLASPFGGGFTTGSDLKGYFYNMNRGRTGRPIPMSPEQMEDLMYAYWNSGWKSSYLSRYYRSPNAIYTPAICIPTVMSELAPQAFGEENAEGYCWAVLYEGELVYPEDITFRFWGVGDKMMAVNVDGETVLICAYHEARRARFAPIWQTKDSKDNTYYFGESRARPSDWITLKAGEPKKIKIMLVDLEGGLVYHMLSVEVKGETYPLTRAGTGPTFPVFRTSEIPVATMDSIYSDLYPGDITLTNGPIFRDFVAKDRSSTSDADIVEAAVPVMDDAEDKTRLWSSADGKTLEATLQTVLGSTVVLESINGKQIKVPVDQLSPEDREYLALTKPPQFDINFIKKSSQIQNPPTPPWSSGIQRPLQMFAYTFGVQVRQTTVGKVYNHDLIVEYFAVGEEIDGDNYVLLERNQETYNPATYTGKSFEFRGKEIELRRMAYRSTAPVRGSKYGGYLVTLTDERGKIIGYKASHEFLFENLHNLKKLIPNTHFNKECKRVIPARPTEDSRGPGAIDGK